jgi:hypothetical protein
VAPANITKSLEKEQNILEEFPKSLKSYQIFGIKVTNFLWEKAAKSLGKNTKPFVKK